MPLPRSPACPLSRTRLEANRPSRDRQSFHAARKVRRRVAESAAAAQSGSRRSARPTSVRVLMAFSRSRLDGDLPFFPVVQSAAVICRLWCASLPYPHPSPTEINKGPLTPSSPRHPCRHHRHLLLRRRLPLPLLPRLAPVEGGHRQLPTHQEGLSRGSLDVFCSYLMVRLVPLGQMSRQWASHSPGVRRRRRRPAVQSKVKNQRRTATTQKGIEVVGTSQESSAKAAENAAAEAAKTVRSLKWARVAELEMELDGKKIATYRATTKISSTLKSKHVGGAQAWGRREKRLVENGSRLLDE